MKYPAAFINISPLPSQLAQLHGTIRLPRLIRDFRCFCFEGDEILTQTELMWAKLAKAAIKGVLRWPTKLRPLQIMRDYPAWASSITEAGRTPLADGMPWVTFDATRFLESELRSDMIGYEYGSGGSTIFLAQRLKSLVTVEHDEAWFDLTRQRVSDLRDVEWDGKLIPPTVDPDFRTEKCDRIDFPYSSNPAYTGQSFGNYVSYINRFPDEYFDIVLVDGRSRVACIANSQRKIKLGGYLVLDNSERRYYFRELDRGNLCGNFSRRLDTHGLGPYLEYFWSTSIWQKCE